MQALRTEKGLILKADPQDIEYLQSRQNDDDFDGDGVMFDLLEGFIANSEWDWVQPEEIGALTNAPILGTFGQSEPSVGGRLAGRWRDEAGVMQTWYDPVLEAYAFMDYQVRSLQSVLLEKGEAFLTSGK